MDICGVYLNRKIIHIRPDIFIICDEFFSNSKHDYSRSFHFCENGKLNVVSSDYVVYESKRNKVDVIFNNVENSTLTDEPSKISRKYDSFAENRVLKHSLTADGFSSAITVFSINKPNEYEKVEVEKVLVKYASAMNGALHSDKKVEAINISKGERKYTVVLAHQDFNCPTDCFEADSCIGFGHAVVFDRNESDRIGEILD